MDITQFIASRRETLLVADYNTYRAQLSRQLRATRKRLGRAIPKREKFAKKDVTAEDIGSNHEFARLLLLTAERAWAHAMYVKTSHSDDRSGKGITGTTRSYIVSRLAKAAKVGRDLVALLNDQATSKAREQDILEARAYQSALAGAEEFEKQSEGERPKEAQSDPGRWQECLRRFAEARVIHAALYEKEKKEIYKDILTNTVDPTIRYAAYQAKLSRTIPIPTIAQRYFPTADKDLVRSVESMDPWALKDKPVAGDEVEGDKTESSQNIPNSVNWRGRKANIVDAAIGLALANVSTAEARLKSYLVSHPTDNTMEKAAAYDDVLSASQDVADATKSATDELEKEKVDEGDARMQDMRVTSLSVNYDLVSWRVGRNRILIGSNDGLTLESHQSRKSKRLRKVGSERVEKEEPRGRKLARLRERNVLYDATIQSINSIRDLRGAMRDVKFVAELDSQVSYFRALKCLNLSYSHILFHDYLSALALQQRARELASLVSVDGVRDEDTSPPKLEISPSSVDTLRQHAAHQLSRTHALVEMRKLEEDSAIAAARNMTSAAPLVKNLHAYPTLGTQVDLKNLVSYPPKVEAVPVKPLFLDVAWNYIDYPGRQSVPAAPKPAGTEDTSMVNGMDEQPQEKKRGWFGFGR